MTALFFDKRPFPSPLLKPSFCLQLLSGGAAAKDGRLRVDDRLIGIENIDLRQLTKNAEASEAITNQLQKIGQSATAVKLVLDLNFK